MPLQYKSFGKTHIGLVRQGNEDNFIVDDTHNVFAVCDGMGGHQAGEVASKSSSETIGLAFGEYSSKILGDDSLASSADLPPTGELLVRTLRLCNRQIHNESTRDHSLSGMGTTVVALSIKEDNLSIAHVGDSRAYLLEKDKLTPLTADHSWVSEMQKESNITEEEISTFVGKNVITRALGVKDTVEVDFKQTKIKKGDIYIICSDGLCGFATEKEIFETSRACGGDIKTICNKLIDLANLKGGSDNSTIIAIRIDDVDSTDAAQIDLITFPEESPELLEAEDNILKQMESSRESYDHPQGRNKPASNADDDGEEEKFVPPTPPNKKIIFAFFAVFIIVAIIIIAYNK